MATENEPAKLLLPYLQRADELQKHEPLVAYYCRLYAMERGLKIPQSDRTKTTNALLVSLMKQLEKDKKSLKLGPDDHLHVEGFALNVFARADKQDRAERADLNTAKTFYAASIFFEILNQFGELQPDLEEKQKYAVWKAADIRKALKEGRKPLPGPPGGNKDLSVPSRTSTGEYDLEPRGTNFTTMPDPTSVDPAARTPPDQADNQDKNNIDQQQPVNFLLQTSNVSHSLHTPTDQYYPPDTFHHQPPPPPTNTTQYHQEPPQRFPSQDAPPSVGIHPAARTPPDQADNQDKNNIDQQQPPDFSRQTSNISYSRPTRTDHYYPPDTLQHQPPPPPTNSTSEDQHSIHHQHQYHPEHPQHFPSQDASPFSYPNFQSYPGFTESGLPTAPTPYPSFYQPNPNTSPYVSATQYNNYNGSNEGNVSEVPSPPTKLKYEYDSSYQPPPEKIAEAHKAARFAVGALAFDDVSIAVEHLKNSLELLTNPSAGH